jgi:aminoglycoside phosphotransferase (APT) family kinase protein
MVDLDPGVLAWVAEATGGEVAASGRAAAGGRAGFWIDVVRHGGARRELFLQRGGRTTPGGFIGFDKEAEVYRALEPIGVPIPHVWGVDSELDLFLVDRAPGQVWFREPRDPEQAVAVASDFMSHLARWHMAGARGLLLPSFCVRASVRDLQGEQLEGIRREFERHEKRMPIDLLARVQLEHLLENVPDFDGEPVLVQGDTGPGNFLYLDDRVTAIVDWELAHVGDPMDDIAWLSWRATQHGWPDFPARLREYEQASGVEVDRERVLYYRLNACARLGPGFGLAPMGASGLRQGRHTDAALDRTADGSAFVMDLLHRRMRLTAQADAMGIELPSREVPDNAVGGARAEVYDRVLEQLSEIGRVDDRAASNLAKGAARQVKFLKEVYLNGAVFDSQETDHIGRLLRRSPSSLDEGRTELAVAAREGRVGFEDYLLYHWERLVRDDWLMRTASGAMYHRSWPALTEAG